LSELRINPQHILSSTHRASLDSTSHSISSSLNSSTNSSIYNNNITVIPNHRNLQNSNRNNNEDHLNRLFISCRRLCVDNHLNETLHSSILDANANPTSPQSNNYYNDLNEKIRNFYHTIPILIHDASNRSCSNRFLNRIHGKNVKISEPDGLIAYRESSIMALKDRYFTKPGLNSKEPTRNGYSFLENPIQPGKSFCIQIVGLDQSMNESKMSLGIGCTTCNPTQLTPRDLPDDADDLLDRPEYWVVHKNLFNMHASNNRQASVADELCFLVDETNGNLNFYLNNQLVTNCLYSVDLTQELYFFFDLCGKTNAIRIIPSCQTYNSSSIRLRSNTSSRRQRPNSALIDYYKNQFLIPENMSDSISKSSECHNSSIKSKNENLEECRICLDAPIECVFYTCGHMCVCWKW